MDDFAPHPFLPTRVNHLLSPDICAVPNCGRPWDDSIAHRPSLYLAAREAKVSAHYAVIEEAARKAAKGAGVPLALVQSEKPSGPPRDSSAGATYEMPADGYLPRGFAMLHGLDASRFVRTDQPIIGVDPGNPDAEPVIAVLGEPGRGKTVMNPALSMVADAMRHTMEARLAKLKAEVQDSEASTEPERDVWALGFIQGLKRNGVTTEIHKCDATEFHDAHLFQPGVGTEWFTCLGDTAEDPPDFCDHPNGFDRMGCPCGASRGGEEDPMTVRNTDTGEDEIAVTCPEDEVDGIWPLSQVGRHLIHEHGWSFKATRKFYKRDGYEVPEWLRKSVRAVDSLRTVACPVTIDCVGSSWPVGLIKGHVIGEHNWSVAQFEDWAERVNLDDVPLAQDMIERQQRQAEVDAFLNPTITTEEIMGLADQGLGAVLTEWWLKRAEEEADAVIPKAISYGSNSLMQLGRKMAQLQGREVADDEALELGCWANLVQKVERMTDSVMRGERCSDDTIYDVGIYIKMVQRIRDAGSWPGV